MSRTLKVTGNVMYDRRAWFFLRIMCQVRALCGGCWFVETNKLIPLTVVTIFFFVQGKGYQPKSKAEADNPYVNLDYSEYHKNLIQ